MNKFCGFLSNGLSVNLTKSGLEARPCCWFRGNAKFETKLNFDHIKDWTKHCEVCHQQELAGQKSFRQSSFDIVDPTLQGLQALDINIDFNCNAACVICDEEASSLWAKQIKKHKSIEITVDYNYRNYLDKILSTLDLRQLRRIKFFGGEPFFTTSHIQVLEKIPNPENVCIWYTTNASILPDQTTVGLWKKFKLVYYEASIDAVDDQFDYLRWPLQWNKVSQNLLTLKQQAPVNLLFRFNHTLNPFNIFYYERFEQWVENNLSKNRLGDPTEINIHPCWGTWGLSKTPQELRQLVLDKYGDHEICSILLQQPIEDHGPIIDFVEQWEPIRKNAWKTCFPEIIKYF